MRLLLALIVTICNSALGFGQVAEFSIDKAVHKFSDTKQGTVVSHDFIIKNTGTVPLIISDYHVDCTCTKVVLPKKPISPGETFKLKVTFDTKDKYYFQDRIIRLQTNTKKKEHLIRFKVKVVPNE